MAWSWQWPWHPRPDYSGLVHYLHAKRSRLADALARAGLSLPPALLTGVRPVADLSTLIDEITKTGTVVDSAVVFINGVPGLIADAVAKAVANGATEAELKPVRDLGDQLKAKSDALAAALTANTPPG